MKTHRRVFPLIPMLILLVLGPAHAQCPLGDLNGDCRVDATDLGILGSEWLAAPDSTADLNGDDRIDGHDLALLADDWKVQGLALFINEVQASNTATVQDAQQQYDDWIELYNGSDEPIDVGGMYLTDDVSVPTLWQIPADVPGQTTIEPQGHLLIWADGDTANAGLHANFSLDADGEEIALFDRDGDIVIDVIDFAHQETDISYGRLPDGSTAWQLLASPTPGAENLAIYDGFVAKPTFSIEHGFYTEEIQVELTTETEGATIYYTTDGSVPGEMGARFLSGKVLHRTDHHRGNHLSPGPGPADRVASVRHPNEHVSVHQ